MAHAASVGDALDALRRIDINDYAVGLGVSHTDNVYAGAADTTTYYPYATRLYPSDFDDGVLFSRARGYGVRWLPAESWEIGALARFQTLGFEADESPALAGLPSRRSTIEIGPTIGWRGTVHVDWTAFVDLLRNHRGASHVVRLSLPIRYSRGYLLPELGLHHYTAGFVDHYFGVRAVDSAIDRPAYTGTGATGASVGLAWGLKIAPSWLLTGRAGLEKFGSAIAESPLVDDRRQGTWSLHLTYDGAPFRAPQPVPAGTAPRVALLLGVAGTSAAPAPSPAMESETLSLLHLDAGIRIARQQRLAFGIIESEFGAIASSGVPAGLEMRNLTLTYGIALLRDRQKELSVEAGLHFSELEGAHGAAAIANGTLKPRPTFGLVGAAHFANRLSLVAKGQWLMLDAERLSGRQILLSLGLVHRTFERVQLGVGYVFNRMSLELEDGATARPIEPLFDGPSLVVTGAF